MKKILFDIGANKGFYTEANRKKYDTCILVEANPNLARELREHYANDSAIEIVHAIASKHSSETFYISNADTISTSDIDWVKQSRFTSDYIWHPIEGIPTVSLDTLISKYGVPELIKIDVEGYEYNVLQSLTQKVPLLCFEWAEEKKEEILQSIEYLQSLGFSEFQIELEYSYTYTPHTKGWVKAETILSALRSILIPEEKKKWGMIWARVPKSFLYIDTWNHHKNKRGFELMCKAGNIDFTLSKSTEDFQKPWDLVFIPTEYIPPHSLPNAKAIMYGPHNFVFVDGPWKKGNSVFPSHCFYNLLSDWVIDLQNEFGGLSLEAKLIPFAVDIDLFTPSDTFKRYDCFVYFKERNPSELEYIIDVLQKKNLNYKIIRYGSYSENEYLDLIRQSKFAIWLGRHESQGFALEECLSCNVPILVWDCTSMFQYHEKNEKPFQQYSGKFLFKTTSIPYWDERCGISFKQKEEFEENLEKMLHTYTSFSPRDFVVETLSPQACLNRLLQEITI